MMGQYFLLVLVLGVGILGAFLYYQSQGLKRRYREEVAQGLERLALVKPTPVTENDIQQLPLPLQNYLRYAGVIGQAKVQNVRFVFEGEMRLGPK